MSGELDTGSTCEVSAARVCERDEPFGPLPRLSRRQVLLESRLSRLGPSWGVTHTLEWLRNAMGEGIELRMPEAAWRPSGVGRGGVVAHLVWPRLATRLGIGLEIPLAHALVDRLLGFDRLAEEGHRQVSPVEWGILTMVVAQTIRQLFAEGAGPLGPWDMLIDRVGPDSFETSGLGRVVTIRWPLRIGVVEGSVRLWLPESLVARWLACMPASYPASRLVESASLRNLSGVWRAEAGTIELGRGLSSLAVLDSLPIATTGLHGDPRNLCGLVNLKLTTSGPDGTFVIPAEPVPEAGGARLTIRSKMDRLFTPREAITLNPTDAPSPAADVPVTLVVELGRLNLTLARLADLKPGDIVELGRHPREPIELTSAGRLVARGELVQIDEELGVRVTSVFL